MSEEERRNLGIIVWLCVLGAIQLGLYLYWSIES